MQSLPTGNSYLGNLRGEEGRNHPPTCGGEAPATALRERRFRRPHRDPPRGRRRRGAGRGRHWLRAGASSWPGPPRGACLSPPPHLEPPLLAPVPAPPSTSGLSGPFPAPALRARPAPVAPPGCRPLPPLTLCSVPRGAGRSRPRHVTRGPRCAPGTAAPSRPEGPRLPALRRASGAAGPCAARRARQALRGISTATRACRFACLLLCHSGAQSQRVWCRNPGPGVPPAGPPPLRLLLCARLRDSFLLPSLHHKPARLLPVSRPFEGPEPMCGVPRGLGEGHIFHSGEVPAFLCRHLSFKPQHA